MKGKGWYWLLFLALVFAAALFLTAKAGYGIWGYMRLDTRAPAQVERWEVERLGTDRYGLVAHYTFEYEGQKVTHASRWSGKRFPNWAAAEAKIVRLKDALFTAYFPKARPNRAVLERTFPFKACIYAIVGLGVAIYFSFLGRLFVDPEAS